MFYVFMERDVYSESYKLDFVLSWKLETVLQVKYKTDLVMFLPTVESAIIYTISFLFK